MRRMAFPDNFLAEIKDRLSVSDVVGRKVRLKRRGREFVGLSPFKSEKTPSFTVNDDKQFYHCFSTGKHGSIFDWLMETEGLSFPEAVEKLAHEAGLPMPAREGRAQATPQHARLWDAMEAASAFFRARLADADGRSVQDYLAGRDVSGALCDDFGIGFAPNRRDALLPHLREKGFTDAQIVEAGLAIKPDDGGALYDRFRNRVMFPIHDTRGRVIAFGGRALDPDAKAKYLNSPETPLFHKGKVLYNFARARQAAYDSKSLLVVEGYMDVIGLARAGIHHAVAPLGTALTEAQIGLLWRLTPEPILCLDGDEAGRRAGYRAIDRALPMLKAGHSLRFATLPPDRDPDDLVRSGGASAIHALTARAASLVDTLWERELAGGTWDTPERRAGLKRNLRAAIGTIGNAELRNLYGTEIKTRLDKLFVAPSAPPRHAPQKRFDHFAPAYAYGAPTDETRRSALAMGQPSLPPREAFILLAVLRHPRILDTERDRFESLMLSNEALDALRFAILDHYDDEIAADMPEKAQSGAEMLDMEALNRHLEARGQSELSARLEKSTVAALHLAPMRPESALEEVRAAWLEVVEIHHKLLTLTAEKTALEAELGDELAQGGGEQEFERLVAIEREIATLERPFAE